MREEGSRDIKKDEERKADGAEEEDRRQCDGKNRDMET